MQELTFEQVEHVSGGFQNLTGPQELFEQLRYFYQADSGSGSTGGPVHKCNTRLGALKCLAETLELTSLFNEMVNFLTTQGPVAWEAFVKYADEKATRVNENGGPRMRL